MAQRLRIGKEAAASPVALFFLLEQARQDNDFATATAAQARLRSLGVDVRYIKPTDGKRVIRTDVATDQFAEAQK